MLMFAYYLGYEGRIIGLGMKYMKSGAGLAAGACCPSQLWKRCWGTWARMGGCVVASGGPLIGGGLTLKPSR
ncbi:hypothetical protein TSUD_322830 [Trifolium subterraneum]|uniref:Uncharacterized protein n=1 Tax=Trifolium subterraneum TaxID=3900 RepID=A0A2Z6MMK1_TRISU|nr:hypothetical protein TSUD_322830 [Trifolium subterraneum]